jgi:hypothetical protein
MFSFEREGDVNLAHMPDVPLVVKQPDHANERLTALTLYVRPAEKVPLRLNVERQGSRQENSSPLLLPSKHDFIAIVQRIRGVLNSNVSPGNGGG